MVREKFQLQAGHKVYSESVEFLDYMYKHHDLPGFPLDFYDFVVKICNLAKKDQE